MRLLIAAFVFLFAELLHAGVFKLPPTEVRAGGSILLETTDSFLTNSTIGLGWVENPTSFLNEMPSIYVTGSPKGKKLFLRGLPERDMKILLNGVPIGQKGVYYTRGFEWDLIPADFVERIEVTRGFPSPIYGDGISGTVNIVTKRGGGRPFLYASYGRFDDWKFGAVVPGEKGPLKFIFGGRFRDSGDYLENNIAQDVSFFASAALKKLTVLGYLSHRREGYTLDSRIIAHSQSASSIYGYEHGSYYNLDKHAFQLLWDGSPLKLSLSYTRELRNDNPKKYVWRTFDVSDYKHDYRTYSAKAEFFRDFMGQGISLGFEAVRETWNDRWERGLVNLRRDGYEKNSFSFFLGDTWSPVESFTLGLGVRYDYVKSRIKGTWERVDDAFLPRLSASYRLPWGPELYAVVSRVFKAPTLADLSRWYGNYMLYSPSGRAILRTIFGLGGSPYAPASSIPKAYVDAWRIMLGEIGPSKGWDYELGVRFKGRNFSGSLNLFYEDIDDYINIYPSYYPATYNVDTLRMWGVELSAVWMPFESLELTFSYTFEESDVDGDVITEAMFNKDELFDAPKHLFTLKIKATPWESLKLEWVTKLVSRRFAGSGSPSNPAKGLDELPGYGVSSFRGSYRVSILGTPAELSLSVENVFSKRFWQRVDYYMQPVSVYGGLKLEF